jgi:uncharacterized protein (DUF2252 family)
VRGEVAVRVSEDVKRNGAAAGAANVVHLDVGQRGARGRAARRAAPRSGLSVWDAPSGRLSPIDLLAAQERTRVPELVPLRHERMLASPFAFYRGAAVVMSADLAVGARTGLSVQCCGDAHLANFGGFASPERKLVFDINDFDETYPAPFEWDVKRLAASFEIASRTRGFASKTARSIVLQAARTYRESMRQFATMRNLEVWYARLNAAQVVARWQPQMSAAERARVERTIAKAETRDSLQAFAKLTTVVDGQIRIISDPPLLVAVSELGYDDADSVREWLTDRFRVYRRSLQPDRRRLLESFRVVDFARKVVGVGSVGTRCWIVLLLGKDNDDPLFLQIKEAERSVLEPHTAKSRTPANNGRRVVEGQRLLQATSDILLGWLRTPGPDGIERDFYVRQLRDWKVSANLEVMAPDTMQAYAQMCGWTLARGHARSGDRVAIAAYLGSGEVFDQAIADFAAAYADQNQRDYESMVAAYPPS